MSSVADICNRALSRIGIGAEIQDPDTETSKEATTCRLFYASCRDQVLRDFPWPRLMTEEPLALVETAPNERWKFSYRVPANVAAIRRVMVEESSRRVDSSSRLPYDLGRDGTGELIYSDYEDAWIRYTYAETNTERWTPDVVETVELLLASAVAPRFGPEAVKLGDRAIRLYEWRRATAQANAMNEVHPDAPADAEFVRSRE